MLDAGDLHSVGHDPSIGFVARVLPTGDGHTWTLTTLLGRFLREAEARYGRRDLNWTPLGIEFNGDRPRLWYPGDCRNVAICLSASAATDIGHAVFQLAHEVIHLLAPCGYKHCLAIEEGLASLFADEVAERMGLAQRTHPKPYLEAAAHTKKLLSINPEAIRELRRIRPHFNDFTPDLLQGTAPTLSAELAADLCRPFY